MNWGEIITAIIAFAGGMLSTVIVTLASRPKTRAETQHIQAEATLDIIAEYKSILCERTAQMECLKSEIAQEKRKAALVPTLTRTIENLETALRRANQQIAALRGQLIKSDLEPKQTGGSEG